ncbi:phosphatidylinositol-specific phospholipase C domain-containing protein [Sphaerisporangium corydalis]|uniref:1-phosphatidylinositol phosphodiesterase n=1 Tax=Sphaerisporangium corydalis TaxID=1441875 RepID=A0ABV9E794_9ACTN|nr:phosphatidylinositol-specific phospholipase C domain-containing protein [Sphaerisporangium corydalis]
MSRSRLVLPALLIAGFVPLISGNAEAAAESPLSSAIFRATHNSYSGNVDGAKNSIAYQLDHGIRFVELDIHDNEYATSQDYSVGHDSPGNLVDHTGNPASNRLRDWLTVINAWSAQHPTAAPIVVALDVKDDLTDNASYAAGNLAALNQELTSVFGSRLYWARDYPATSPSVDALRGRVLAVISGDGKTRTAYKRDIGYHPAVAINSRGQVVQVNDSGAGVLWYWTGSYGADGRVTWLRHGRYDTGVTPAVALNDNGDLVEVHQSQSASTLWYHVGHLGADGEITWSASRRYDDGVLPTVRFTDAAGTQVREIHRSNSSNQNWTWNGSLNAGAMTVAWSGNAKTSDARYDATTSASGASRVHVWNGADGSTPAQTLRIDTDRFTGDRIRFPQTAFGEFQKGDSAELQQGALFYAAPAGESSFITAARQAGRLVRGWDFDSAGNATNPLANYPATNHPYDTWYQNLLTQSGAAE